MGRTSSTIREYITAPNKNIALKLENKLIIDNIIPIQIFLGFFNMIIFLAFGLDLFTVILSSGVYFCNALFLIIVKRTVKNQIVKTNLILLALTLFLTFIIIEYYQLLGTVVWIISVIFIVISIGRNDLKLLVLITCDLIVLLMYTYLKYPEKTDLYQYLSLCVALTCLLACAVFIKKINVERYKFISEQLEQSDKLAQISTQMIGINSQNVTYKINQFVERVGKLYNIDNAIILLLSADGSTLTFDAEWCAKDIEPIIGKAKPILVADDYWWTEQLQYRNLVVVSDIEELDSKTSQGKCVMQSLNIKSLMSIPFIMNDRVYGFLIIHSIKERQNWRDDQMRMMTVFANILGDAYTKIEAEKEINRIAYYDSLTGLANRFLFNSTVDKALAGAKKLKEKLAILFIDLDSFKSVNDTMGHEGGDALLSQVALSLRNELGEHDFAARFGGDEFIIMLSGYNEKTELEERTLKIMGTFSKPVSINGQDFFVTASAGISVFPDDGDNRDMLIKNADLAMYTSKELGKNQHIFCTQEMKAAVEKKVLLTNKLYKAQQNNEFVLYYQPQINISTKNIIGLEALIRWKNPELGMISPGEFIPLAEKFGLINSIGQWVFETACRQNKAWQDMGLPPVRMAVNLSVEQFRNPNLIQMIRQVLLETGLEPKYVELEITESVAIKETNSVIPVLAELRSLGVTISIDDFGTEYSSLARIKNLPIDRIKMAMEFVHGITVSDKDEAIAKVIITLANNLGLKVIAEGVETETQLNFLEKRICDEVQGFYFYKPMPAHEVEQILYAYNGENTGSTSDQTNYGDDTCGSTLSAMTG